MATNFVKFSASGDTAEIIVIKTAVDALGTERVYATCRRTDSWDRTPYWLVLALPSKMRRAGLARGQTVYSDHDGHAIGPTAATEVEAREIAIAMANG